ncbi:MAG: hypothetical protein AAFY41_07975 [Bacteroidota bacterium]
MTEDKKNPVRILAKAIWRVESLDKDKTPFNELSEDDAKIRQEKDRAEWAEKKSSYLKKAKKILKRMENSGISVS